MRTTPSIQSAKCHDQKQIKLPQVEPESPFQTPHPQRRQQILHPTKKQPLLVAYSMQQGACVSPMLLIKSSVKKLQAILTGKDAILKEVQDCVLRNDPDRLKEISPYIFSYWQVLSVKHRCFCLDKRIAIPMAIKDEVLEDIHSTHTGSFAMLSLAQKCLVDIYPSDILARASECKACA